MENGNEHGDGREDRKDKTGGGMKKYGDGGRAEGARACD